MFLVNYDSSSLRMSNGSLCNFIISLFSSTCDWFWVVWTAVFVRRVCSHLDRESQKNVAAIHIADVYICPHVLLMASSSSGLKFFIGDPCNFFKNVLQGFVLGFCWCDWSYSARQGFSLLNDDFESDNFSHWKRIWQM